ncbi:phosphatidylserine decarboxylase [Ruegeria sp. ANG-R]|uniref:phosphatidylserine decarboxylase n=1 Tax=Ruegeria sp. ANG-R TaxID=1577903 RepID=UPI000691C1E8|nr:phosphatidylserine decarboxylase [Ruegeria sp. ANG-R]
MSNPLKIIAVPMHPEGRKFVAAFTVGAVLFGWLWAPLFWIGAGLTVWCYYFFRDPVRSVPQLEGAVLSPADGVVSMITRMVPPDELALERKECVRVSIFMDVFNCHVNRMPIEGLITRVSYHHGKFLNASLDKASEHNERNALTIRSETGAEIGVVQIAGLVARRIVCFANEGDTLRGGDRFGLIRFGSRLDIYLPPGVSPQATLGQTTVAGETILANLRHPDVTWKERRV